MLCKVIYDLSSIPDAKFKMKNRHSWQLGQPYMRIDYLIKVSISPTSMKFELCRFSSPPCDLPFFANQMSGFGGKKVDTSDAITVEWKNDHDGTSPMQYTELERSDP